MFYSCWCFLWRTSFCPLPKRPRGDMQWERQWCEGVQPLTQKLKRKERGLLNRTGEGSSGEPQCSNTLMIGADVKPGLTRADHLSLVHSPSWKASLDNLIQRSCSLSVFQIENCFLRISVIWGIFILRPKTAENINLKEETKKTSTYLHIYISVVI